VFCGFFRITPINFGCFGEEDIRLEISSQIAYDYGIDIEGIDGTPRGC